MSERKIQTDVTEFNIAYPEADDLHLRLSLGAMRLSISPGEGEAWVTGTYDDRSAALPAKVVEEGGTVRISQTTNWAEVLNLFSGAPKMDLVLGKGKPYRLTIEAGASDSTLDLGALPITRLAVTHGAGKFDIDFSAPNPQEMSLLKLGAGAAGIEVRNLANANFAELSIDGGAAAYKFDFGGSLQRSAHVRISTGMSSVEVHLPAGTAAKISSEKLLGELDIGDGFTKRAGGFWTQAAVEGKTPVITIHTSVALGSLRIRTT